MPPTPDCSNTTGYHHVVKEYAARTGTTLLILILVPNAIVIGLVARNLLKSRKLNVPRIFVLGLALTDFGYGALNVSLQVVNYWLGYCASGGKPGCVMRGMMSNFLSVASLLIVVSMSFERFVALKMPFKYDRVFSVARTAALVLVLILYSFIVASLPLFGINRYGFRGFCDFYWPDASSAGSAYTYFRAIQGLLTMPVLLGFNAVVIREVWMMRMRVRPEAAASSAEVTQSSADNTRQIRIAALVLFISVVYISCNTPYCVRLIEHQMGVEITAQQDIHVKRTYICQSIVNPLLYLLFNLSGYRRLHSLLKRRAGGGATSQTIPVTTAPYSVSATL